MAANSLQELFLEELRDTYDGEKRLTKALPKLARAATSSALQQAFTNHLRETEGQITRLEQVFRAMGEKPRGKTCEGIKGIVEEGSEAIQELDKGPVLDAALIAGAQKAEHYEIASYGTLAYFAEILGQEEAKELLGETLDEEKAADEKLSTIAKSKVNREALMRGNESGDEEEESSQRGGLVWSGIRRGAAAVGLAQDRGSMSRSRSSSRSSRSSGRGSSSASRTSSGRRRSMSSKKR
jgi:ferritin-like metal-binding protein YciE